MQSKLTLNNDVRLVDRWCRIVCRNGNTIVVRTGGEWIPAKELVAVSDANNQNEKEQK